MEILNSVGPRDEVVEFEVFYEENALGEKVYLSVLGVRKTGQKEKKGNTKLVASSKWKWWNDSEVRPLLQIRQGKFPDHIESCSNRTMAVLEKEFENMPFCYFQELLVQNQETPPRIRTKRKIPLKRLAHPNLAHRNLTGI
jgi:hypothetical protein